ncbi:MAG: WD40 repeat domain-containing protein, partial [Bacteroidota bacterium]
VDRKNFSLIGTATGNEPSVFAVAVLPDTLFPGYISGGRDARLRLFEMAFVKVPKLPAVVDAHMSTINDLAFDPTGRYLATASRDKTVKIWDASTLKLLKVCEVVRDRGHVNSVNTLLWLDERTLITAGDDRRILTWKLT